MDADSVRDVEIDFGDFQRLVPEMMASGDRLKRTVESLLKHLDQVDDVISTIEQPEVQRSLRNLAEMNREALVFAANKLFLEIQTLSRFQVNIY